MKEVNKASCAVDVYLLPLTLSCKFIKKKESPYLTEALSSSPQPTHDFNVLVSPQQMCNGLSFKDLPVHVQNKIFSKLSDAYDIINLGQTTPALQILSENKMLWKKLCHFHFSGKQVREHILCN